MTPTSRRLPPDRRDLARGGSPVLIRLFRTHLIGRYRGLLILLLGLQIVQAGCSLLLPAINAKIIDNGVLTGDTDYIWRMGGVMLAVAGVQMVFAIGAMYVSAKAAMGFGRDVRSDLFHRVTSFSQREVNQLGAPSLITRITNDVQQVQLLGVMVCSMAITAPIMAVGGIFMAMREDLGLSALLLVSLPVLVVILLGDDRPDDPDVPPDAGAHRRREPGHAGADHRHPGGAGLRP